MDLGEKKICSFQGIIFDKLSKGAKLSGQTWSHEENRMEGEKE